MRFWLAVAAASIACNAWLDLNLYTRLPLATGFKQSRFPPQGREGAAEKVEGFCQVLEEALSIAHKDHDRLILARELMGRGTAKIHSNSKLPDLVELCELASNADPRADCH